MKILNTINTLCRLCTKIIKKNTKVYFLNDNITDIMSSLFTFEDKGYLYERERLPIRICCDCYNTMMKLYTFKIRCEGACKFWKDYLKTGIKTENIYEDVEEDPLKITSKDLRKLKQMKKEQEEQKEQNEDIPVNTELINTIRCNFVDIIPDIDEQILENSLLEENTSMNKKSFQCEYCKDMFKTYSGYYRHKRQIHGKRRFICKICKKTYFFRYTLKKHMLNHSPEMPFRCDLCNKRFHVNSALKAHYMTHTGEKPFKCNLCERAFRQKATLKDHMRLHSIFKPYECNLCDKGFTKSYVFRKHMKQKHGQPYSKTQNLTEVQKKVPDQTPQTK